MEVTSIFSLRKDAHEYEKSLPDQNRGCLEKDLMPGKRASESGAERAMFGRLFTI